MAAKPGQEAYHRFRSWVAQQRITVDTNNTEKVWKYYDFGPKDVTPLVFLGGASATAEVFYRQFLSLCPKGYHLISVQFPSYMDHASWNKGFDRFLDKLGLKEVHLFGTSLGGYLAQSFAQYHPKRVASIILSNTFTDTSYYVENAPCAAMFPMMPEFMLKRMLLENLPSNVVESEIADSIDFMVHQLETMNQSEISSRMTLNCTVDPELRPIDLHLDSKVTILDTLDEVAIPEKLREEVYKIYPHAKVASLKTGGNFPFLSRSDEVNMHIQVHLRNHGVSPNENKLGHQVEQLKKEIEQSDDSAVAPTADDVEPAVPAAQTVQVENSTAVMSGEEEEVSLN